MVTNKTLLPFNPVNTFHLSLTLDHKYPAKLHAYNVSQRLPSSSPSLIYLRSQPSALLENSDQPLPFRQRRYFAYLSGAFTHADSHITYDPATKRLTLYIPPLNPQEVLWTGMPKSKEECLAEYDVDEVKYSSELRRDLDAWVMGTEPGKGGVIYCLDEAQALPPPEEIKGDAEGAYSKDLTRTGWGYNLLRGVTLDFTSLKPAIDNCRVFKTPYEINLLRKAINITARAHRSVLEFLRQTHGASPSLPISSLTEADLEAEFQRTCIAHHAKNQAYEPIFCSGRSCATLHYTYNAAPLVGKQLALVDAGCEFDCYASDITRTYPINGIWTPQARVIYSIVEKMQQECIAATIPGAPWRKTHLLAARIAVEGLLDLGILVDKDGRGVNGLVERGTWKAFYPHGLGHMIGLETHDVEGTPDDDSGYDPHLDSFSSTPPPPPPPPPRRRAHLPPPPDQITGLINRILKPGMVLTVEPGIYFCEWIIEPYLSDPRHAGFIDASVLARYWDVGGVRIEDMVLINEQGNEVLSVGVPRGWEAL